MLAALQPLSAAFRVPQFLLAPEATVRAPFREFHVGPDHQPEDEGASDQQRDEANEDRGRKFNHATKHRLPVDHSARGR